MLLIGENLNVINMIIGKAFKEKNPKPIAEEAKRQKGKGMDWIDINLGPARKGGPELMEFVVKKVQEEKPDLILLDVMMPKKTGFTLFKQLRKDERFKELPVLPTPRAPIGSPPTEMSPYKFAKEVERVLDETVRPQLQKDGAFVWVERKVDPATARRVRDLELDGVGFLTEHRRYYPQRELAAHVLGWAGLDNTGMSGIEYSFEDQIAGRAAQVVVHTDARRRPVGHTERPATDGHTAAARRRETPRRRPATCRG